MTRKERYASIVADLTLSSGCEIDTDPGRYLLIEEYLEYCKQWIATFATIEDAAKYPDPVENGFFPDMLIDLDTGNEYQPVQTWAFEPSMLTEPKFQGLK